VSLIDLVQQNLGPAELQQISQQMGVDQPTAERAIQSALPSMVAGMAGTSQEPAGANTIESLLGSHSGVLGNLGGLLRAGAPADGGGILDSILGRHGDAVNQHVQQASGFDSAKTRQLLMILAPIVLGALARHRSQAQTAPAGGQPNVGDVLRQEAQTAQQQTPGMGGLLGKILSRVETPRA
jgi:hypothetical protein